MDLKFNAFGKVKMEQIKEMDLPYVDEKDGLVTYSELKEQLYQKYGYRIHWNYEERVKYCEIWLYFNYSDSSTISIHLSSFHLYGSSSMNCSIQE